MKRPILVLRDGTVLRGEAAHRRLVADDRERCGPTKPTTRKERPTDRWRRAHPEAT